jgi:hypothetical protein
MTEPNDCDNGWIHLCGGPHTGVLQEVTLVNPQTGEQTTEMQSAPQTPYRPAAEGGCQTVRCTVHCSCFGPDGVHDPECALAVTP